VAQPLLCRLAALQGSDTDLSRVDPTETTCVKMLAETKLSVTIVWLTTKADSQLGRGRVWCNVQDAAILTSLELIQQRLHVLKC